MKKICSDNSSIWNDILKIYQSYADDIEKIRRQYKLNIEKTFNIFSVISDQYQKENLHSDIIRAIIGQESDCLKSKHIMKEFLKFIGINQDSCFCNSSEIIIQREYSTSTNEDCDKGRVDLLIYDDDNAIILENKVNGAPDMENQLAKYYEQLHNEGKKILKIVYFTLNDSDGPKNFDQYSKPYQKYIKKIKEKLICISAVSEKKDKSFSDFLRNLRLDKESDIEIKKVFLSQYCQLLDSLGGRNLMLETEIKCLEEIFNDESMVQKVNNFVDLWDKRFEFIGDSVFSKIQANKKGFKKEILRGNQVLVYKIQKIEEFYIYYASPVQIGFFLNDNKYKEKLKEVLSIVKTNSDKSQILEWSILPSKDNEYWLYMIANNFEAKQLTEIETHIEKCLDDLVTQTKKVIGK